MVEMGKCDGDEGRERERENGSREQWGGRMVVVGR
jgi:hypothetical protein